MAKSIKEITPKQARFVREYQLNFYTDPTAAYRKSFNTDRSTKITTSRTNAYKLLKEPHIIEYIAEQKKIAAKRAFITIDDIVDRLDKSAKRSESKGNEKSLNTSLMNIAKIQGQGDGPRNTFSIKDCTTLKDIQTELHRAVQLYAQDYLTDKEMKVIESNLTMQMQIVQAIDVNEYKDILDALKAKMDL